MQQPPGGPPGGGYPPGQGQYGQPPFGAPALSGGVGPAGPPSGQPPNVQWPPPGGDWMANHPPGLAPSPVAFPPRPTRARNVVIFVAACVVLSAALGITSCILCVGLPGGHGRHASEATPSSSAHKLPLPQREHPTEPWITAERPYVKFMPPVGWRREISQDREWGTFTSPTGDAVLAFTTFSQSGESTARLYRAASVLGVVGVDWHRPTPRRLERSASTGAWPTGAATSRGPTAISGTRRSTREASIRSC